MSIYNLDLDNEESEVPSHRYPTLILQEAPIPGHLEEVHRSPVMDNISSERNSVIHEEDNPSNYNIE